MMSYMIGQISIHQYLALHYASNEVNNDKEVIMRAVSVSTKCYPIAIQFASKDLRNDKDVAIAACTQDGRALSFISDSLKNDQEVVLTAVNQRGVVLQFASDELKSNMDVCLAAVTQDPKAMVWVNDAFQPDAIRAMLLDRTYVDLCRSFRRMPALPRRGGA